LEKKEIGRPKEQLCKNCTISTKDKISQETGVSPRTIIYDAQLAEAVEELEEYKTASYFNSKQSLEVEAS